MKLIEHPAHFKTGTRVLFLKGRYKDGIEKQRMIGRVTHSVEHFNQDLAELAAMAEPGERIYGSAGERDMPKAIREFKRRQLDADYDGDPELFYRAINARWIAALMAPTSQMGKLWLFDCDTVEESTNAMIEIVELVGAQTQFPYVYNSKSGQHIIARPFDRSKLSDGVRRLIHENPIMLWGY